MRIITPLFLTHLCSKDDPLLRTVAPQVDGNCWMSYGNYHDVRPCVQDVLVLYKEREDRARTAVEIIQRSPKDAPDLRNGHRKKLQECEIAVTNKVGLNAEALYRSYKADSDQHYAHPPGMLQQLSAKHVVSVCKNADTHMQEGEATLNSVLEHLFGAGDPDGPVQVGEEER
ncbi:MAG: hypothetical protein JST66_06120 [Bacteroidetes bacterium]|nr:hypothetical protein [Bacteroidota bacterium]